MNQKSDAPAERTVMCRRTDQPTTVTEHARCPYCFGELAEIRAGDHRQFCDFDPSRDPINFGFPPDGSRHLHG